MSFVAVDNVLITRWDLLYHLDIVALRIVLWRKGRNCREIRRCVLKKSSYFKGFIFVFEYPVCKRKSANTAFDRYQVIQ